MLPLRGSQAKLKNVSFTYSPPRKLKFQVGWHDGPQRLAPVFTDNAVPVCVCFRWCSSLRRCLYATSVLSSEDNGLHIGEIVLCSLGHRARDTGGLVVQDGHATPVCISVHHCTLVLLNLASWQGIVPPDDIRRRIRLTRGMLERDILGVAPQFLVNADGDGQFASLSLPLQPTLATRSGSIWFFGISISRRANFSCWRNEEALVHPPAEVVRSPFTESQEVRDYIPKLWVLCALLPSNKRYVRSDRVELLSCFIEVGLVTWCHSPVSWFVSCCQLRILSGREREVLLEGAQKVWLQKAWLAVLCAKTAGQGAYCHAACRSCQVRWNFEGIRQVGINMCASAAKLISVDFQHLVHICRYCCALGLRTLLGYAYMDAASSDKDLTRIITEASR